MDEICVFMLDGGMLSVLGWLGSSDFKASEAQLGEPQLVAERSLIVIWPRQLSHRNALDPLAQCGGQVRHGELRKFLTLVLLMFEALDL